MTFDRDELLRDVGKGLSARPRQLPSKYFYDEAGSRLFDQITRLPEYYPTRAERTLLQRHAATIMDTAQPATLVELGAGSSDKTRLLLDQMLRRGGHTATYIPVDVSADFLASSADRLRTEYPSLDVLPVVADFSIQFDLPPHPGPALHAFLGSTIGNFEPEDAIAVLSSVRQRMASEDSFLLGVDLRKDPQVIERAYNDSDGVTARFNLNILDVINQSLGADFDTTMFDHRASYNSDEHRIEMYLISRELQDVNIPGLGRETFAGGEAIRTELSYKYEREMVARLLQRSGLRLREWFEADAGMFALALITR